MMNKLKDLLSKVNVPMALVCLFTLKCLFFGINFADALVSLGFTGLYAYRMFLDAKHVKINTEYVDVVKDLRTEIDGLKVGLNMRKAHGEQKKDRRYF